RNDEDGVVSADVVRDGAVMLFVSSSGHGKRTKLDAFHRQGRGGQGVRGMKITASRGAVVAAFTVTPEDEILVFSSAGNIIRMGVMEISAQGRDATGVRVARLGPGESVSAVAPVLETEAESDVAGDGQADWEEHGNAGGRPRRPPGAHVAAGRAADRGAGRRDAQRGGPPTAGRAAGRGGTRTGGAALPPDDPPGRPVDRPQDVGLLLH